MSGDFLCVSILEKRVRKIEINNQQLNQICQATVDTHSLQEVCKESGTTPIGYFAYWYHWYSFI